MKFGSFYVFEESPTLFDRTLCKDPALYQYYHSLSKEEQNQLRKDGAGMEKDALRGYLFQKAGLDANGIKRSPDLR